MRDNIHEGHRQRLKSQYDSVGEEGLSDVNFLELLLFYAVPRRDTNPLAHGLLDHFGTFDGVLRASKADLMEVDGVGESVATYLTLFISAWKRACKSRLSDKFSLTDTDKLKEFIKTRYLNSGKEKAMIIHFDSNLQYINYTWIAEGTFSDVQFDRRAIAAAVAQNKSTNVVCIHNHPSGIPYPSGNDIQTFRELNDYLSTLRVNVADNVIYTEDKITLMTETYEWKKMVWPALAREDENENEDE